MNKQNYAVGYKKYAAPFISVIPISVEACLDAVSPTIDSWNESPTEGDTSGNDGNDDVGTLIGG